VPQVTAVDVVLVRAASDPDDPLWQAPRSWLSSSDQVCHMVGISLKSPDHAGGLP
jgi:hypothetical protein